MTKHITPAEVATEWLVRAADAKTNAAALLKNQAGTPTGVCFTAHQVAEMSLKAILVAKPNKLPHIHDLPDLVDLVTVHIKDAHQLYRDATLLNPYYRDARYPGTAPLKSFTWEIAQDAFSAAERIYNFAQEAIKT